MRAPLYTFTIRSCFLGSSSKFKKIKERKEENKHKKQIYPASKRIQNLYLYRLEKVREKMGEI